jgi:hypothetical protein
LEEKSSTTAAGAGTTRFCFAFGETAMTRYQLAKLVQWAGTLQTRKRMQKVVYLLQAAGCPLEADYRLHLFGPYSHDVAWLTDEMVQLGLLAEEEKAFTGGQKFNYALTPAAEEQLAAAEATAQGREWAGQLAPFETVARDLLQADLKELEIAATIAYFHQHGNDWPAALEKACRFKELKPQSKQVTSAEALARKVVA